MDKNNKQDIEYRISDCFKEICRLQELEGKGQALTHKEKIWLEQICKDLDNLNDLLHRAKIKRKYEYSGRYDENGKRILEKGETVDSCNIISKSTGKDTWRLFFQLHNSEYALGVTEEIYEKNNRKIQYVESPFVEFIDVLRIRAKAYLEEPDRGHQVLFIDTLHNTLTSYDLGDIPDEYFLEAMSEIPYNKTLHDIMTTINKIPQRTWDKLRPYSKDYKNTQSIPADEITDEKKSDIKTMKKIIEDKKGDTIEDIIQLERNIKIVLTASKEKLPDKQREVFEIKRQNPDMTFKEVGQILKIKIKETTARDRYNRAIKNIKKDKRILELILNTPN